MSAWSWQGLRLTWVPSRKSIVKWRHWWGSRGENRSVAEGFPPLFALCRVDLRPPSRVEAVFYRAHSPNSVRILPASCLRLTGSAQDYACSCSGIKVQIRVSRIAALVRGRTWCR